ncbi:MAG: sterol desaturase family protein [Deltaproteobacteria bacterium]|nr:sterol desaturase family protein [Deltaproteobacteria bacterium]
MELISYGWIRPVMFVGGLLFFLFWELVRPYRPTTVSKGKRWFINLALTGFNSLILNVVFGAAAVVTAVYARDHGQGVLNILAVPRWANFLITIVFMDFMLYVWHLLNHVVPLFWRFHRVHHTDLNMDVSTATRFHLGELSISMVIKIALVYLLGADPVGVVVFEALLVLCAQFQHSCLAVSASLEKIVWVAGVPPSMHRIHHSVKIKERNSNYGTIFSLWDRSLGTLVKEVDQDTIKIGVGGHFDESKLGWGHLLVQPFTPSVH